MNIVLGRDRALSLTDRYVVLTLDTFRIGNSPDPVTSYCVVENVPINDMASIEIWKDLHEKLIENYTKRNWVFCEQAIEHLMGKWNGELDSFYQDLLSRVRLYADQEPDASWTPVIMR